MSSQSLEEEIRRVLHAHLTAGTLRGIDTIDEFMAFIADEYTGIGTGPFEFIRDRNAFREITIQERKEMAYEVSFELPDLFIRLLRPDIALAEGSLILHVHMETEIHDIQLRYSILFEHQSSNWLIIHSHYSVPDYRMDAGGTLMDALQVRNAELEQQVNQRTAELNQSLEDLKAVQTQLIHQEKMASLGALTAGIAHEIKNPLNFITNFARLSVDLANDLETDLANGVDVTDLLADLKQNAIAINNHGKRADAIVQNMMRHASGKTGERVQSDLHKLLDEYITLALHGKKAKHPGFTCTIEREYDQELPPVKVIPGELGRVFLNLLSNAFDVLQDVSAPLVSIETKLVGTSVHIRFSDNGPGIDSDIADKIFDPFFTTKPAGQGTGLGLSLSYDIITQGHRGKLELGASQSGGATFLIDLPLD